MFPFFPFSLCFSGYRWDPWSCPVGESVTDIPVTVYLTLHICPCLLQDSYGAPAHLRVLSLYLVTALYALCRQYLLNRDWVQRIRGTTSKATYMGLEIGRSRIHARVSRALVCSYGQAGRQRYFQIPTKAYGHNRGGVEDTRMRPITPTHARQDTRYEEGRPARARNDDVSMQRLRGLSVLPEPPGASVPALVAR